MPTRLDFKNATKEVLQFMRFVIANFFKDDCPYRASALAFTSLLAIIPLMTVGFTILSVFPVFQSFVQPAQNFIFENFVPTTGKIIENYFTQFLNQVSRLSTFGVSFLFITAILLLVTIEHAMNKIWKVTNARKGNSAFLLYWAILSLGPVFIGLSLAASSYLISILFLSWGHEPSRLFKILPMLFSLTGFTLLYYVVPNCKVYWYEALGGGVFASILFELAKHGFALYLSYYNSYELLYGAFATIPIFFIWIYWVWIITLFGAEVSYAISLRAIYNQNKSVDGFSHALLCLYQLWLKQKEGKALSVAELNQSSHGLGTSNRLIIRELKRLHLIHQNEQGYFLSRDLNEVSLFWLSQNLPYALPAVSPIKAHQALDDAWQVILDQKEEALKKALDINLASLFSRP